MLHAQNTLALATVRLSLRTTQVINFSLVFYAQNTFAFAIILPNLENKWLIHIEDDIHPHLTL